MSKNATWFVVAFVACCLVVAVAAPLIIKADKTATWMSTEKPLCSTLKWEPLSFPIPVFVTSDAQEWAPWIEGGIKLWSAEMIFTFGGTIGAEEWEDPIVIFTRNNSGQKGHAHYWFTADCKIRRVVVDLPGLEADEDIRRRTGAHDIGHALGLGHSERQHDVMYEKALTGPWSIPAEDLNLIAKEYEQ